MDYESFLCSKIQLAQSHGFEIGPEEVNPLLAPFQIATVRWAVAGGRRAIFKRFGLGKTFDQIEIVRIVRAHAGGMGLIVLPLGVRQEFIRDAQKLATGDDPKFTDEQRAALRAWQAGRPDRIPRLKFVRSIDECDDPEGIYLTNYETVRDGRLDPRRFVVASLDEADCLRGFGGSKTFREFMALFAGDDRRDMHDRKRGDGVRYRFVATATPSPNEYVELLAYCAYLGVMDVGQAKTRFFKRNSEKADQLTIHPHKEREFWLWMASWALFVQLPSDLDPSFSDEGYVLPPLDVRWHEIPADHSEAGADSRGQNLMFKHQAIGVVEASREKRESMGDRIARLLEILDEECRIPSGLHEGVLHEEPGAAAREAAGARQGALPGEQGAGLGQEQSLAGGQSGAHEGTAGEASRGELGSAELTERGLVPEQSAEGGGDHPGGEAAQVRSDARRAQGDPGSARTSVPDLRAIPGISDRASDRPLARHRKRSRGALQALQHGAGSAGRQPGQPGAGAGVSEHLAASRIPQVVVWCDLNDEQRAIERALDAAGITYSSLYGSQSAEEREVLLDQWRSRATTVFLSKTSMYGAGVNLQQSSRMVFAGIHFKAKDVIQGVHRIYRFLQPEQCRVHFIYTEAEREVRRNLERKWQQDIELREKMSEIIKTYGLSRIAMAQTLSRAMGVPRVEVQGPGYVLVNEDCVQETRRMQSDSVGLILTSIPFSTQYEYSPNYADFGHTDTNEHFWQQMDFLVPELLRVLQPGRVAAIHVKNRIVPSGMVPGVGFQTEYPFDLDTVACFRKHGFHLIGRKTIVTDVVRENAQTYRLGWTEQCKDGSRMGFGLNEYLLLFRKAPTDASRGYADIPVFKDKAQYSRARWQLDAHGFTRSSGNRLLAPEDLLGLPADVIFKLFREHSLSSVFDFEHDVALGEALAAKGMLPPSFMLLQPQSWHDDVWTDITRMRTLNGAQSAAGREMHLCPMQFDIADRAIAQYSNLGDEVYDPFGGLMTVPYRAIKLGRRGRGCELSPGYFADGVMYCEAMAREMSMPSLFDLEEIEAAA